MRISAILSLLSAGENRSLFIMPEIYGGINERGIPIKFLPLYIR